MNDQSIEKIKQSLIKEYNSDSWEDFVDRQDIGNCREIIKFIIFKFKNEYSRMKRVFGEIKTSEPYYDDEGDKQKFMIHYWLEINNDIFDFSKGTLQNYIDEIDLNKYEPDENDDIQYTHKKYKIKENKRKSYFIF